MKIHLVLLLISMLLVAGTVFADDDPETPLAIEERCVSEPTAPPDDWTYSGTLLMSGYAGIHAMQAGWETPRIVAFFSSGELGEPHVGGQLSPDGRWYAVPIGETWVESSFNQYWQTNGLTIYSTVDDTELNFELREYNSLLDYGRSYGAWTYEAVRWIDNNALLFGPFRFRPFEQSVEASSLVATAGIGDFEVAPDWTRIYGLTRFGSDQGIFDPKAPDEVINFVQVDGIAWQPDSSGFIGKQRVDTIEQLVLFTKDGEFIERLFVSEEGRLDIRRPVAGRNDLGWSPDNRYFAFTHYPPQPQPMQLMLVDRDAQVVVNTCLRTVSEPVWSPDGSQLAVLLRADENLRVTILDLDTWAAYDVARHSDIGGVLQPDMIAWRSNE